MDLITGTACSSLDLAQALAMPERAVEEHLVHIVKSVARDRTRRFVLQPAACDHCGFVFKDRTRLTTPSRCPRCQSERIHPPRYEIRVVAEKPPTPGSRPPEASGERVGGRPGSPPKATARRRKPGEGG